jgi:adrenodoxin-NADP+ reductase
MTLRYWPWGRSACRLLSTGSSSSDNKKKNHYSVAIVGTGPSGCYTAKYLLNVLDKKTDDSWSCHIDMLERLPTPYGLVRFGVAPDHPEVKNVENDFAVTFQDPRVQFLGNVHVGSESLSLAELRNLYDIVVLAYGCESDRKLSVPGEDNLQGILSAREFVAWYNGHPHFEHIGTRVAKALSGPRRHVVVIGQGNVALDCARILAKGAKGLMDTDISSRALEVIGHDGVPCVSVVGRRGHVQGAFTIKELRELTKLEDEGHGTKFIILDNELDLGETPASKAELDEKGAKPKVRIHQLLRDAASKTALSNSSSSCKEVRLRFLLSPKEFLPCESESSSMVGAVVCERTRLEGEPGHQRAVGTGQLETIPADLVLISIGYKGTPLPGLEPWFDDQRGVVIHQGGKVENGLYVSGWLKRGPSGIIGTNIMDAKDTVVSIVRDIEANNVTIIGKPEATENLLDLLEKRNVPVVHWMNFEKINAKETSVDHKRTEQQPREKIVNVKEMLEVAGVVPR